MKHCTIVLLRQRACTAWQRAGQCRRCHSNSLSCLPAMIRGVPVATASRLAARPFAAAKLSAGRQTIAAMAAKRVLVPIGNGSEEMEAVSCDLARSGSAAAAGAGVAGPEWQRQRRVPAYRAAAQGMRHCRAGDHHRCAAPCRCRGEPQGGKLLQACAPTVPSTAPPLLAGATECLVPSNHCPATQPLSIAHSPGHCRVRGGQLDGGVLPPGQDCGRQDHR